MDVKTKRFVTVDAAIFSIIDGKLKVFLKEREKEPFKGFYELLGGFVHNDETCEQTLSRKLREVSPFKVSFTLFNVFSDPERDPVNKVVTIAYLALVNEVIARQLGKFFDINSLPNTSFDHKEIILSAKSFLKSNLDSIVSKQSLPVKFPLNDLQHIYEAVLISKIDNRNFRKRMLVSGIVNETGELERNVTHRPAMLYSFSKI